MKVGEKRLYNKNFKEIQNVVLWDVFPVTDGETLQLTFESKNSEWLQGVRLACDQGIEIEGKSYKGIRLWYEDSPTQIKFKCHTKNGLLSVYNIWDRGGGPDSGAATSGMLVEDIASGRRYKCNDIGFEPAFDKLIFRIERLAN